MNSPWIGRSVPRRDGTAKVSGDAVYIDDLQFPGMLYGATVRSDVPRGRLMGIDYAAEIPWDEFVIVTAADIPGHNCIASIHRDQPALAAEAVHHCDEPVLLLAHPRRDMVERARRGIHLRVDPSPAVETVEQALAANELIWGSDNILHRITAGHGDVDAAMAAVGLVIVEGEYRTGAQEQLYIEPQGMIAHYDERSGVTVRGSLQCPYYVHGALQGVLGLPGERVRVIQTTTGGGFGGKEEYPSMLAAHAALLAYHARRPIKMVYDRVEDIRATTKRHPSITRHRTAVTRDGQLVAMDIDFMLDGGAYATLSSVVLSRGVIHAAGPYRCANVRIVGRAVATNHPPYGAFRGFGAPQSLFALERHLDRVAQAIGLDPVELRRRNFLRQGDHTAVGQVIHEPIDLASVLDAALARSRYNERRAAAAAHNATTSEPLRRGIGLACYFHGAGFTGAGEVHLNSVARIEVDADAQVRVLASSTEIGQGTNTIFPQIVADALGINIDRIAVVTPDTDRVPDSGPTVASRTAMVVGELLTRAAVDIRDQLGFARQLPDKPDDAGFVGACMRHFASHATLVGEARYQVPPGHHWDEEHYRGDAYAAYAWACCVAEVEVDLRTAEVRATDIVAVQEVGKVLHPTLAVGQIQGGMTQALGWALYEDVRWVAGRVANAQMSNYIIPTAVDTPEISVAFLPPFAGDQAVAKGIGELPMDGLAPALLAAVQQATGVAAAHIPLLPETLMHALETGDRD